ncbi:MAG: ABC transporter permease [Epsilonproteobacteria bacterium]|nr:MAG: ABC transporter permease [Campylobacterota bacterium]
MVKAMLIKEFLLVLRDKHALAALFVMPAVFILIMSLALKDAFNEEKALVSYTIVDRDHSVQSEKLLGLLGENRLLNERNLTSDTDVQFMITVPKGFKRQFTSKSGREKPLIIEAAADVKQDLLALFKSQVISAFMQVRVDAIKTKLEKRSASSARELDAISFDEKKMMQVSFNALERDEKPNSTQQSVPAWIVFGMFFVIIPMSTIFISERKQNTLFRLLAMNVSLPLLFGGKIIPYLLINQLQVWVMIAVGMFVVPLFGAEALTLEGSVGALILVSLALSLSAIGLSMLIAVTVESVEQATTIGGIINILLGAIGGVMVPKFIMPDFMQTFSNVSPMSWGLEGFLDVLLRREGIEAVLPEVAALTLFGIVLLAVAAMIFKMKVRRGL